MAMELQCDYQQLQEIFVSCKAYSCQAHSTICSVCTRSFFARCKAIRAQSSLPPEPQSKM